MLISENYRQLNKDLHAGGSYGQRGDRWAEAVQVLLDRYQPSTILDYGCGAGALGRALNRPIGEYDPAIEGKDGPPAPADMVVCTDVLEHIEPECLDDVLDDLRSVTRKQLFAVISTRPAAKKLVDGRNAHLIIEPWPWWEARIRPRFDILELSVDPEETRAVLAPRTLMSKMRSFFGLSPVKPAIRP